MSDKPTSPLRRRMIEDMTVRNFVEKTRNDYIRHVRTFTAFLGRAPDTATPEDLRLFQLHQTQTGARAPSINGSVVALRFFFTVTLDRPEMARHLTFVREPLQSLFDHHQPSRDHRALPRDQPLRRQPPADGGRVPRLPGPRSAQQWRRARDGDDALGDAPTAAHRRPACHQHPQHVIPALARLAETGEPVLGPGQ
jgi:Phage integrase, N-terminal SAM-like domain